MYNLENNIELTDKIKEAFKKGLTRAYLKYDDIEINPDNYLMSVEYGDEKADPQDGRFIGKAICRSIDIKLNNKANNLNLENKEVEYYLGALVDGEYVYIKFGNFIVQKPENQEVNEETTFTALDYMSKFDVKYTPIVTFPATIGDIAQDICNQCGVELGNIQFRNSDKVIEANPFIGNEQCREVIKSIAKVSFTSAYIWQDNKLYFGFDTAKAKSEITWDGDITGRENISEMLYKVSDLTPTKEELIGQTIEIHSEEEISNAIITEDVIQEDISLNLIAVSWYVYIFSKDTIVDGITYSAGVYFYNQGNAYVSKLTLPAISNENVVYNISETISIDNYYEMEKNNEIRPITIVTLRSSEVEASGQSIRSAELIEQYGPNELIIEEDYFAFTDTLRQTFLQEASALFGLTYHPINIDLEGSVYLSFNDFIEITNLKNEKIRTYCLNNSHTYNGTLYNNISVPALTETEEKYIYQDEDKTKRTKTAIEIDKANQRITETILKVENNTTKLVETEMTIDGIKDTVVSKDKLSETVAELKRDIEGVTVSLSEKGGNNLIYYDKEFWNVEEENEDEIEEYTDTEFQNNSISGYGYRLNNGHFEQTVQVVNGVYTVSLNYKKLKELAIGTVTINGFVYELSELDWTKFVETIEVNSNYITIEFDCDTLEAFYVTDLLINLGDVAEVWTQNPNETRTDTVKIGKGIEVTSTLKDTKLKADADGVRIVQASNENNIVAEFTDKGTKTKNLEVEETAEISGLLFQKVNYNGSEQTWISSLL